MTDTDLYKADEAKSRNLFLASLFGAGLVCVPFISNVSIFTFGQDGLFADFGFYKVAQSIDGDPLNIYEMPPAEYFRIVSLLFSIMVGMLLVYLAFLLETICVDAPSPCFEKGEWIFFALPTVIVLMSASLFLSESRYLGRVDYSPNGTLKFMALGLACFSFFASIHIAQRCFRASAAGRYLTKLND